MLVMAMIGKGNVIPNKRITGTLAFAFILLVFFISLIPAHADIPTQTSHDKLIEEIKANADRHVRGGSPMQTQFIVELYRNNTIGLNPTEIAQIYEEEYNRFKEIYKPSPWEQVQPNIGWGVALIFFLLLIFRDILKKWLTNLLDSVGNRTVSYTHLRAHETVLDLVCRL